MLQFYVHEIRLMAFNAFHMDWKTTASTVLMLVVALLFASVGAARWVEFLDFPFSKFRRRIFIALHLIGCFVFALAFALEAIDLHRRFALLGMGLLASSLLLLFPIHIYLGLLRRVRDRKANDAALSSQKL